MEAEQEKPAEQEQPTARPRREKKSKFNNAALEDLASARGGGRKRTDQFQVFPVLALSLPVWRASPWLHFPHSAPSG